MNTLFFILFLLSIPTLIYFVVRWIISGIKKNIDHATKMKKLTFVSAGVMLIAFIGFIGLSTMFYVIAFISTLVLMYFIVRFIISRAKKNDAQRLKYRKFSWIAFAVLIVSAGLSGNDTETEQADKEKSDKIETSAPVVKSEPKEEVKPEPVIELTEEEKEEIAVKEAEAKKKSDEADAAAALKTKEAMEAKVKADAEKKVQEEAEAKALAEQIAKAEADKKANAQTIPYAQLKKNPDRYAGEYVKYTGEIVQILEGGGMTNIRLSVVKDSYGYSFNDLVYIEYDGYTDFVDGDIVTIFGEVYGAYSYESQAGYNISLPGIIAEEVTQ